jgi:uncharacterized protein (TIGR02145 family)
MKSQTARSSTPLRLIGIIFASTLLLLSCSTSEPEMITGTVTDIDGNEYQTVKIGDQWWMAENLRVTHYKNGEEIPKVTEGQEWPTLTTGAYTAYENDYTNILPYGLLYNWYAVDDSQGICPEGWHVPSDEEWMALEIYLGMPKSEVDTFGWRGSDEGGKLKEAGTDHWWEPNTGATNETGLSVLPSGGRASDPFFKGMYDYRGTREAIWSSTEYSDAEGLFREFWHNKSEIERKVYRKGNGFTVRCITD